MAIRSPMAKALTLGLTLSCGCSLGGIAGGSPDGAVITVASNDAAPAPFADAARADVTAPVDAPVGATVTVTLANLPALQTTSGTASIGFTLTPMLPGYSV